MARKIRLPPASVTERIARNKHRSLPEFEQHYLIDGWGVHWAFRGVHQARNWRAIEGVGGFIGFDGEWHCLDCAGRHPLPFPNGLLICPVLPLEEATTRARGTVEKLLARTFGQPRETAAKWSAEIAELIVGWAEYHPSWGRRIRDEFRHHPRLGEHIAALEDTPIPEGDNRNLPPEAGELISSQLELVRWLAIQRAAGNDSLVDDLDEVGRRALEDAARRFDPTRGVPFGAFARQTVRWAMDGWLSRGRFRTQVIGGGGYDMNVQATPDARRSSSRAKRRRANTGGFKEVQYISRPVQRPPRLIAANRSAHEAALAKLNPKQRAVYRGRMIADPPVSAQELAKRLRIKDVSQIWRILKQAKLKMKS
jgi:RNA polymerase sigma factor (sigma-70 family)